MIKDYKLQKHQFIKIETTSNKKKILEKIGQALITKKLSPCVYIKENISTQYLWKDEIATDIEHKLTVKTVVENTKTIQKIIKKMHNYKICYISSQKIKINNSDYKKWFLNVLQ
tara:strand:+ start:2567 stop:2908 length:342 start_codon:yes stop_codon:yes gene_type:complete